MTNELGKTNHILMDPGRSAWPLEGSGNRTKRFLDTGVERVAQIRKDMSYYDDVYNIVQQIPPGNVSTYGRIAALTPVPRGARGVGWALAGLSEEQAHVIPWWRVINAAGRISNPFHGELQRALLEAEGIVFDQRGYVDLQRFLWEPRTEN